MDPGDHCVSGTTTDRTPRMGVWGSRHVNARPRCVCRPPRVCTSTQGYWPPFSQTACTSSTRWRPKTHMRQCATWPWIPRTSASVRLARALTEATRIKLVSCHSSLQAASAQNTTVRVETPSSQRRCRSRPPPRTIDLHRLSPPNPEERALSRWSPRCKHRGRRTSTGRCSNHSRATSHRRPSRGNVCRDRPLAPATQKHGQRRQATRHRSSTRARYTALSQVARAILRTSGQGRSQRESFRSDPRSPDPAKQKTLRDCKEQSSFSVGGEAGYHERTPAPVLTLVPGHDMTVLNPSPTSSHGPATGETQCVGAGARWKFPHKALHSS